MALTTVQIDGAWRFVGLKFSGGFRIRKRLAIAIAIALSRRVMVVLMMTEVPGHNFTLMPAVRCHCRPAELERQQNKKEDGKEAGHCNKSNGHRVFLGPTQLTRSLPSGRSKAMGPPATPTPAGATCLCRTRSRASMRTEQAFAGWSSSVPLSVARGRALRMLALFDHLTLRETLLQSLAVSEHGFRSRDGMPRAPVAVNQPGHPTRSKHDQPNPGQCLSKR